jgi:penicillin-binding protein 2
MLIFDQLKKNDRPLQLIAIGVLFGMGILLAGLWYLQVLSAKRYRVSVQDQSIRTVRVPALRGKILDRNRVPLVDNRPSYNINLYLEELRRDFHFEYTNRVKKEFVRAHPGTKLSREIKSQLERQARYRVASNSLSAVTAIIHQPNLQLGEKDFHRYYDELRSLPLPLVKDLSFQQVALFAENSPIRPSVALDVQAVRVYPYKTTAAHLVGRLRRNDTPPDDDETLLQFRSPDFRLPDFVGVKGTEWAFDKELRGQAGVKMVQVNSMQYRQSEEVLAEAEPGKNIILTIDLKIQQAAEKALQAAMKDVRGAVVVMDTNTGDILAMASAPTFDPNLFLGRIPEEEAARLSDGKLTPEINRAIKGRYAPGSAFKIVVSLACLEAGLDPGQVFHIEGLFRLRPRGRPWGDTAGPGDFDFRRAFAFSSNPYFQTNGVFKAGERRIIEMGRRFGLGESTGLPRGLESPGYFPNPELIAKADGSSWRDGDTANLSIGQGEVVVTPLQMAVMTAAVANGGKVLQPRLVARIEPQDPQAGGETIEFPSRQIRRNINVNPAHLQLLHQAMLDDVEYRDPVSGKRGTGHDAFVSGMRVCGKTGTAEVDDEQGHLKEYIVWFVSFAPYESPRYATAIVVEGGSSGGGTCAPIARSIYQALLKREQEIKAQSQSLADINAPGNLDSALLTAGSTKSGEIR